MGAPKGNNFWTLRSKSGRDANVKDPNVLWKSACEYFQWCVDNPHITIDYKGKDAVRVEIPKMRAFTEAAFSLYLGFDKKWFLNFKQRKIVENNKDFQEVIARIEDVIYEQKFSGAAAGLLAPNIIARDLGLIERKEVQSTRVEFSPEEREKRIQELMEKANRK